MLQLLRQILVELVSDVGSHRSLSQSRNQALRPLCHHFLSAYLAPLSGSESYGVSLTSNHHTAQLLRCADQCGFRPGHSTASTLRTTCMCELPTGFNQRKPSHRTVWVAVGLIGSFRYSQPYYVLLSIIVRSTLPEAACRWMANYLRGRQSVTSCRGVKSMARIVHTGAPQGSKMSPTLLSFYLADMPRPTELVKRICYADDITVWASGVKLLELEHKINDYLTEMSRFLRDNSLLISAPKSTVTLFTPDPKQANTHPKIKISDAELPLFAIQSCWECV